MCILEPEKCHDSSMNTTWRDMTGLYATRHGGCPQAAREA